jgi:hypothetical protein
LMPVQERAGNTLELTGIDNNFLNWTSMAQQLRERIDKWNYVKLKSSCKMKEIVTRLKGRPQNGRKSLPPIHLTKD